jgi:tRNA nucleotidyltransferase (CCA-adding enzyme)
MELVKLLVSDNPDEMRTVYELGLTAIFLPEFDRMMETPQNTKHHCYSVGEHTLVSLKEVEPDTVLRLTMLLHDVAKPDFRTTDENGQDHFKGHPAGGAELAKKIMHRLKFDNDTTDRVCRLIRYHDDRPAVTPRNIRRAISRIGADNMKDLLMVKRADTLAQSEYRREEKLAYLDEYENMYNEICRENQCVQKKDLAINGRDLIELGMQPGKAIGDVLDRLFEAVLDDPDLNTREQLLNMVKNNNE